MGPSNGTKGNRQEQTPTKFYMNMRMNFFTLQWLSTGTVSTAKRVRSTLTGTTPFWMQSCAACSGITYCGPSNLTHSVILWLSTSPFLVSGFDIFRMVTILSLLADLISFFFPKHSIKSRNKKICMSTLHSFLCIHLKKDYIPVQNLIKNSFSVYEI